MHTAALPSMLQSSAAARIDFITATLGGTERHPHLQSSSMIPRSQLLRNLHCKQWERQEEGKHALLMRQRPKKALERVSQLSCHKLKTSHFQSPKSPVMGRQMDLFQSEKNFLLQEAGKTACIYHRSVPAGQSSWLSPSTEDRCSASPAHQKLSHT